MKKLIFLTIVLASCHSKPTEIEILEARQDSLHKVVIEKEKKVNDLIKN